MFVVQMYNCVVASRTNGHSLCAMCAMRVKFYMYATPRFQCVLNETSDRYREQDATGKNVVRLLLLRRLAVAALSLFPFSLCNRNCVFGFFLLPPFFFLCPNMHTCLYVVLGRATYNNTVCDCTIFVRNLSVPALTSL